MKRYIKRVFATTRIAESTNMPKQGIFWVIDDELVVLNDPVSINGEMSSSDILHIDTWKYYRNRYKVNGHAVKYDYFPRGRVMVMPIWNDDRFDHYDCYVYGDSCIIDEPAIREEIEAEFRLYLSTCKVYYDGQLSIDGTHYTCHNCRK